MTRSRFRLLKVQHFAEDAAQVSMISPCVPVVYERRSKCKLKTCESRIGTLPGSSPRGG